MMRPLVVLTVAAACGGNPARSNVSNATAPGGERCPSADRIRIATYTAGLAGSWGDGAHAWRMPLRLEAVDQNTAASPPAPITVDELRARGVTDVPSRVWLYRGLDDDEPCMAEVGGPYRIVGGDGLIYEELGVELTGCPPAPRRSEPAIAWASLDETPGCSYAKATAGDSRAWIGERWDRQLTTDASLPAALVPFVPRPPAGAAPEALLWETRAAYAGDRAIAWELDTSHISSPLGTEACNVEADEAIQHFAVVDGRVVPLARTEDDRLWAHLHGAFTHGGVPRVVMLVGNGSFSAIDIAADGAPGEPRTVEYYIPHDEDGLVLGLRPYCGP